MTAVKSPMIDASNLHWDSPTSFVLCMPPTLRLMYASYTGGKGPLPNPHSKQGSTESTSLRTQACL